MQDNTMPSRGVASNLDRATGSGCCTCDNSLLPKEDAAATQFGAPQRLDPGHVLCHVNYISSTGGVARPPSLFVCLLGPSSIPWTPTQSLGTYTRGAVSGVQRKGHATYPVSANQETIRHGKGLQDSDMIAMSISYGDASLPVKHLIG